jgi:hypothetical protein
MARGGGVIGKKWPNAAKKALRPGELRALTFRLDAFAWQIRFATRPNVFINLYEELGYDRNMGKVRSSLFVIETLISCGGN